MTSATEIPTPYRDLATPFTDSLIPQTYIPQELDEDARLWYLWYDSEGHQLFRGSDNVDYSPLSAFVPIESDESPELTEYARLWYQWYDSGGHELFCSSHNVDTLVLGPPQPRLSPVEFDGPTEIRATQPDTRDANYDIVLPVAERFICTICGEVFQRRQRLEAHENMHHNENPYVCGGLCGDIHCLNAYSSQVNLKRHRRPMVNRYKPCKVCTGLILRQNMARHLKTCRF